MTIDGDAVRYATMINALRQENEQLKEEKDLVSAYISGATSFAGRKWNLAIEEWGPIYVIRPTYQNGELEEQLREACANSTEPDPELCPP